MPRGEKCRPKLEDEVPGQENCFSLGASRHTHSHPGQWKSELQQFLLRHSETSMSSHACKACERSLRRGMSGKCKGEHSPHVGIMQQELKKKKLCCCVYTWLWYLGA